MKSFLAILASSFLLCSCADMYVTRSSVGGASSGGYVDSKDFGSGSGIHMRTCGVGAHDPKAIYIRPFCIDTASFVGDETESDGEMPMRKALTPVSFAVTLKEQLEKIAPARVLKDNESPRVGWLVEGEFIAVDGGDPTARFFFGHFSAGQSHLAIRVRVTDVETGVVAYDFDVAGGSHLQGRSGTIRASGVGRATPFDLVNAAERIYLALEPNADRFGARSSIALRQ